MATIATVLEAKAALFKARTILSAAYKRPKSRREDGRHDYANPEAGETVLHAPITDEDAQAFLAALEA